MAKQSYVAPGCWIIVTDAGPGYPTSERAAVPQIVAFRIHRDTTDSIPFAEGAAHVGRTGINKAEYLAALLGLRLVADRIEIGDWSPSQVHLVSDNSYVCGQLLRQQGSNRLARHFTLLWNECIRVSGLTGGQPVIVHHATSGENSGADALARRFRTQADSRLTAYWKDVRQRQRQQAKEQGGR